MVTRKLVNRRSVTISPSCKRPRKGGTRTLRPDLSGAEHARRPPYGGRSAVRQIPTQQEGERGGRWLVNLGVTTLVQTDCSYRLRPVTKEDRWAMALSRHHAPKKYAILEQCPAGTTQQCAHERSLSLPCWQPVAHPCQRGRKAKHSLRIRRSILARTVRER